MNNAHSNGSGSGRPPTVDTERLRQALTSATAGEAANVGETPELPGWTNDCPTDVGLWHELALGRVDAEQAGAMKAHAATCPACAAELQLAESFASEPLAPSPAATEQTDKTADNVAQFAPRAKTEPQQSLTSSNLGPFMALAATLLLAFGAVLWFRSGPNSLPQVAPPGQGDSVRAGAAVALVTPIGSQAVMPLRFSWTSPADVDEYLLRIQRVDGSVAFEATTTEQHFEISEDEIVFETGVRYEWSVTANLGSASTTSLRESFVVELSEKDQ